MKRALLFVRHVEGLAGVLVLCVIIEKNVMYPKTSIHNLGLCNQQDDKACDSVKFLGL
jgi:hypothetical protein